jgi:hypothetical protein
MHHSNALRRDPTTMSQPTWEMRSATEADMRFLASRLTKGSLDEIDAVSKFQPISVLLRDLNRKGVIVDRRNPDRPLAVFEAAPVPGQQGGAFWSALTDKIAQSDWLWTFSDHVRSILNFLQRDYSTLSTYVDARNVQQMGWLESVGFNHVEDVPQFGRKELKFHILKRVAPNV